jgi:hypothetical protein
MGGLDEAACHISDDLDHNSGARPRSIIDPAIRVGAAGNDDDRVCDGILDKVSKRGDFAVTFHDVSMPSSMVENDPAAERIE